MNLKVFFVSEIFHNNDNKKLFIIINNKNKIKVKYSYVEV